MLNLKSKKRRLPAALCISGLVGLTTLLLQTQDANAQACTCAGGTLATAINVSPTVSHVGDTITITRVGASIGSIAGVGGCVVTNGIAYIMYPNGNTTVIAGPPTGNGHNGVQEYELHFNMLGDGCAGPDSVQCVPTVAGDAACVTFTTTYVVAASDVGIQLGPFITPNPRPDGLPGGQGSIFQPAVPKKIHFATACDAFRRDNGQPVGGNGPAEVAILFPNIAVSKQCVTNCAPFSSVFGSPINFIGAITNTGDTTLTNVTVVDSPTAAITYTTTTTLGNPFPVSGGGTLVAGDSVSYSGSYQPTGNFCGPFPDTIVACGTDTAPVPKTVCATNTATCTVCTSPAITVTKQCPATNGLPGGVLTFSGTVCNTGNVPLTNVTVVNDRVLITGTTLVASYPLLTNGECRTFSGSEVVPTNVCSLTDTLTARATNICSGLGVVATATTNCPILTTPSLAMTKICPLTNGLHGGVLGFSGTITNTGNVSITNIVIVNNQPAANTAVTTIPRLDPGQGVTFSGTEPVPSTVCAITDILSASGRDICNNLVSASATNTCPVSCVPQIKVYKQVVCYTPTGCEAFDPNLNNQKNAFGVRVDPNNCPAFCYRIVVTNTGNVTLTNVLVVDDSVPNPDLNLVPCNFPTTLLPGASASCVVTNVTHCSNTVNIVTATGTGPVTGSGSQQVTSSDTNNVVVAPIAVNCTLLVSTDGGANFVAPSTCATQNLGSSYIVRIVVTNSGQYALQNVIVSNVTGLAGCIGSTRNLGNLAVGASATVDCTNVCSTVGRTDYAVAVFAVASQSAGHVCDFNSQGVEITASSQCAACVICKGPPSIKVYKQVVCYTPTGCEAFDINLNNQKNALGVRVDPNNCPAFCYRITVTNDGAITLTNVTVIDDSVPNPDLNLIPCAFPTTLAPGASASCVITNVTHCSNTVNVVTAAGIGFTGTEAQPVSSRDTNNVVVNPISVSCTLLVSTNGGGSFFAPSVCATQALGSSYIVRIVVTNSGQYALQNVIVSNVTGLAGCIGSTRNLGNLAVGAIATIDCTNVCSTVGRTDYAVAVFAVASQSAGHVCDFNSQGVEITASSQCAACVLCEAPPAIKVYKQVVCYTPTGCEAFDVNLNNQKSAVGVRVDPNNCPAFCYRITVTNSGPITLTNVTVIDDSVPNPDLNLTPCGFPTTLAPGASASCIVTNVTHCNDTMNVVTAAGIGFTGSQAVPVSSRDTNNVTIKPIAIVCTLTVSTNGGASFFAPSVCATQQINLGNTYIVRIAVTNTGLYDLQNVTISNVAGLSGCLSSPRNIGILTMGNGTAITCTNTCGQLGVPTEYAVYVRGEASQNSGHVCDHNAQGIQIIAESTCRACVVCTGIPCIGVTKGIACVVCTTNDGGGVILACASATGGFNEEAFGVRSDTQDPAFCYQIVVTNCGDLALNVAITDEKLGLINVPIGILAPRATFTTNLVKEWHVTTTNTVIANGVATATGQAVSATDSAIAHIRPASIACSKYVSVNGGPFQQTVEVTNETITTLVWSVTVTNTGEADLENLTITDLGRNDLLPCQIHIVVPGNFPVGGSYSTIVCSNATGFTTCLNTNIDNDIRVTAQAAAEGTNCVWDINGSNIVVQTTCDAHVISSCVLPNACRVTGGGRQDDPVVCPADVRYVTHGGQVGAPVGISNCVVTADFLLGNPCIHGRWTHVRHAKGGLEGNFHARFYDTLTCVCLAVEMDSTGLYADGNVVDGRCNPGDRIAGPEPRKAPANKIIFTGTGDWADPNGRRAPRATLFRVDIEDRGEPGGSHPGGGKPPADRYRIRIWVLTDAELAALNNPSNGLLDFRNAIAACNGAKYRDGVFASEIGNNCGGPGTIVFPGGAPVRLPDIDDGGELLHGNHQIHPAIMPCDPYNPKGPGLAKP